jgi:hypothetical protein
MPKTHTRYAPVYRRRMVELVRAGRSPDDLAREFEPTAQSIRSRGLAIKDRSEQKALIFSGDSMAIQYARTAPVADIFLRCSNFS